LPDERPLRSYLYAPGSDPELMEKALAAGADAVVLDLEDAVPPDERVRARHAVQRLLHGTAGERLPAMHVRVNRTPDGFDLDDVRAVVTPALDGLRLPKVVSAAEVSELALVLDELEARPGLRPGQVGLYATIESARGTLAAPEIATARRVRRLVFGATDFLADIGAPGTSDGPATLTARGMLVLASRAAGIAAPVDSVHTILDDPKGLRRSAASARQLGFFGKSVIHPRQLAIVHDVFAPTAEEVAQAREVIATADAAARGGVAASRAGSQFVDPAVVARARAVLRQVKGG
jgi:citrate lyase subunit beta/citryl-CoA lyase